MENAVLRKQWQFLLISQIMRGKWLIEPGIALSQRETVQQIMNRDWEGFDQTRDLDKMDGREDLPVCAVSKSGEVFASSEFDKAPSGSTAIIPLKGTMLKYGTMCTYGTEEIAAKILEAGSHKKISSLVLDIDSGGGAVDAVAPIVQSIAKVRNESKKPVIGSCDLAASAAYWSASACNKIVANNEISAEFGSIGVMMGFWDVIPHYEKEGFVRHTIYAPESNWKNEPFELALKGEYEKIKQEELSPLAIAFQNAVKANRGDKLKLEVPGLLNGRMFFAKNHKDNSLNAKEVGLIDEVGTLDIAIEFARDLAKSAFVDEYLKS